MSAEQTGRPTEQEWAAALHREHPTHRRDATDVAPFCECVRIAVALRPLIAREREAARAEGVAAVAGPVLALAEASERDGRGGTWVYDEWFRAAIPTDAVEALERLRAEGMAAVAGPVLALADERPRYPGIAADDLRSAIPADAVEALEQFKAQWQAEERERIAQAIEADTQTPLASTNHRAYAGHFARIARTTQKEN